MKKKLEAWIVWLVVDIILTVLYAFKNIQFVAIEYFIFCIIAIYGTINWLKIYKKSN
jgi:nicotinamide mononucleotide transporter